MLFHIHASRIGAAIAILSSLALDLTAQLTVVVPCDLDNTLYEDPLGTISNGKGPSVFVGQTGTAAIRRAVLRFDVANTIPAGASILAASLTMNVVLTSAFAPLPVDAHRMNEAWGEGNSVAPGGGGAGAPALPGDATWLHSFYNTNFWTPGGNFAATPSFSLMMPLSGPFSSTSNATTIADVQSWLNNPATNFGWLLKAAAENTANTARRLDSRQTSSGIQPGLIVTYMPAPGSTGIWGTGCPSGAGTFDFAFTGGGMIGGQTIQLSHTNGPANGIGANFFTLAIFQPGIPVAPACNVYLAGELILGNLFLFDNAGAVNSPWPVPTGYPGLFFISQTVALDNTPLGYTLTNAGTAVIQ